ncbi:DDB1- and CUL4-associated factor 15-like [Ptychodera flava]|uniref:DDB1- and CUL4-associated factor 15-like n=1 Tax=Ptychodera flava TaxID=63121 RepID=UPI003969D367
MAATTSVGCSKYIKTGISSRKFKSSYNVINRLQIREVHGTLQPSKYHFPQYRSVFGKIPGRLCIPLKDIVDMSSLLEQGHVFLGFTKDGQLILSYTLRVEAHEHTALPIYVYRLHWWHFNYQETMTKVSEVRLFGEEEIQDDLYIAVCSWPTDPTKVFVYGSCPNGGSSDEKRQCYITITAVPPISPCKECAELYKSMKNRNNNNYFQDEENSVWNFPEELSDTDATQPPPPPRCLKHGLVVHTKYELSPPFPLFAPKFSLKRDGLAVINTGYSLIALGVKVNSTAEPSSQSSLYSTINSMPCTQNSLYTASNPHQGERATTQTFCDVQSPPGGETGLHMGEQAARHYETPPPSMQVTSVKSGGQKLVAGQQEDSLPLMFSQESHYSADSQNLPMAGCDISQSANNECGYDLHRTKDDDKTCTVSEMTCRVTSNSRRQVVNIQSESLSSGLTGNQNSGDNDQIFSSLLPEFKYSMKTQQDSCDTDDDDESGSTDSDVTDISQGSNDEEGVLSPGNQSVDSKDADTFSENESRSACDAGNSWQSNRKTSLKSCGAGACSSGGITVCTDPIQSSYNQPAQPSRDLPLCHDRYLQSNKMYGNPTKTDSQSGCFGPQYGSLCEDSDNIGCDIDQSCPIHGASTINLSWSINTAMDLDKCNCQQRGFNYSVRRYIERPPDSDSPLDIEDEFHSMLPLEVHGAGYSLLTRTRRSPETQGTYVEVKQLTMDAEQYISEAVKYHAKWQDRYLDFTDYDMQILDVCPDSCHVLVMILTLVRAKPEYDPWSLDFECEDETPRLFQTGFKFTWNLKTGLYETLEVEDLKEFDQAQLCNQWNPGRYLCQKIQRDWSTPQGFVRSVHVLTNEAVWKRQSLKKLVDPVHFVAITL